MDLMGLITTLTALALLALPVACVSWTVTHEEVFAPLRGWFKAIHERGKTPHPQHHDGRARSWPERFIRHMAYAPTCEYCFSHYVALLACALRPTYLLGRGPGGFIMAWFACVWLANLYMNLHFRLRLGIKLTGVRAKTYAEEL